MISIDAIDYTLLYSCTYIKKERKQEASKQLRKVGRKEEPKGASKERKDRWTTFEEGESEEGSL